MKAKVIKTDESVIYQGNIHSFNDEFEIDDSIGKSLVERGYIAEIGGDLAPAIESEAEAEDNTIKQIDFDSMEYPELKSYAAELGISAKGKRDELIARIKEFFLRDEEIEPEEDAESAELPNTGMPE